MFFRLVTVWVLFLIGCSDQTETPIGKPDCVGDACPTAPCESESDCPTGSTCSPTGECVQRVCVPGSTVCSGSSVTTCNALGDAYENPVTCPTGECFAGACGCTLDEQCGEGKSCDSFEICGEDGACENYSICRTSCAGSVCGFSGELCCEGQTPVCSPVGACAPQCDGAELCGSNFDECCAAGDVCIFGGCITPGIECQSFNDCDWGEYCDPGLARCMPNDFPDEIECRLDGDFREFDVRLKWSWEEAGIISIPVVGDVTGDGQPNVVINTTIVGDWMNGQIIILDSAGVEVRRIAHDPASDTWGSQGRSNIALGDVDGDGVMDIIYAGRPVETGSRGPIVAVKGSGELIWTSKTAGGEDVFVNVSNGAITVANFDNDPTRAEIVVGGMLIGSDGTVHWNHNNNGPLLGGNVGYQGGVALVADLTGDGKPEIVTGNRAWRVSWGNTVEVTPLWTHDGPDGYPAIADFDGDGQPEIVLVGSGTVRILEGATGKLWCGVDRTGQACDGDDAARTQPLSLPGPTQNNRGGPPTVADFDGDGRPEIGVAGGHFYAVFDVNRGSFGNDNTPEEVVAEGDAPAPGAIYVRWSQPSRDLSSNATGSGVFDFQGNGVASVIYGDECFMRSYSGADGSVELEIMNSTGTILEYPLVVDVDANGRSEILIVANNINHCSDFENYQTRQGLFVYEDPNDRWVRTRSIWNQHAYSIDNILDGGMVPATQVKSWTTHNTFRANRQGEVPLNAPDVAVTSVLGNALSCPTHFYFQATVQNRGTSGIPAGLPVSLYSQDNQLLQTVNVTTPIAPGGTVVVHFDYRVPSSQYNQDLDFFVVANDTREGDEPFVPDCNPMTAIGAIEGLRCNLVL